MKRRTGWLFFLLFAAYLVLCFGLLVAPERGPVLLPLFAALFIGVGWAMGAGAVALLGLVTALVAGGSASQGPSGQRGVLVAGLAQIWGVWFFLRRHDHRRVAERVAAESARRQREQREAELRRDVEFYRRGVGEMKAKTAQRQNLAAAAKDLGAAPDTAAIQERLLAWTQASFPDAHTVLSGLLALDPVDAWVVQRRQALLVEDLEAAPLFRRARVEAGTRSLLVAPLWVEAKIFGGLRVESAAPRRFDRDDLRVLDALATLASLALDNALLYARIEQSAVRDGLTRLFTHKAFEERLQEELLRAGRYRTPLSLVMIDVDHFKRVNDTHGHPAGDEVLRRLSGLLAASARPVDVAARYGGEEFALLLVETPKAEAVRLAETLRGAFARERFEAAGRSFQVSLSAGVAVYPDEATTAPQLVRGADQRLYRAKAGGRDRVVAEDRP